MALLSDPTLVPGRTKSPSIIPPAVKWTPLNYQPPTGRAGCLTSSLRYRINGKVGRIWPCGSVMRSLGGGTGAASPWREAPRGRKSPVAKWWWWLPASDLQRFDTRKGWRGEGRLRVSSFPPSRSNGGYSRGPPLASLK